MLVQRINELDQGKGEKVSYFYYFVGLFVWTTSLGPACKKENRLSSRCRDDIKTEDIHA